MLSYAALMQHCTARTQTLKQRKSQDLVRNGDFILLVFSLFLWACISLGPGLGQVPHRLGIHGSELPTHSQELPFWAVQS